MESEMMALASLKASQEAAMWAFWSMIGTWFSGIATFMAVCLTLYISNRRPRPKLRGTVSFGLFASGGWSKPGVTINVANIGNHSAIITSLTWAFGAKNTLLQMVGGIGDDLPKRIEHGESAFFFIQNDPAANWAQDIKYQIVKQGGCIRKLKLLVHLATGDVIKIKPGSNVRHMIEGA